MNGLSKKAREFCKTWPQAEYHPEDLTVFYEAGYKQANTELEQRLKEAEEVIAFYADKAFWFQNKGSGFSQIVRSDSERNEDCGELIGGKRAREYQKKYIQPKEAVND